MLRIRQISKTVSTLAGLARGQVPAPKPLAYMTKMVTRTKATAAQEPFLSGSSSNYVEEMYNAWLENPKSVHKV